jgi:hypothetical protein
MEEDLDKAGHKGEGKMNNDAKGVLTGNDITNADPVSTERQSVRRSSRIKHDID